MLGVTLAENLRQACRGHRDHAGASDFDVVGVYRSFDIFENGGAVVPLATLQDLMVRPRSVTGFTVELEPTKDKRGAGRRGAAADRGARR